MLVLFTDFGLHGPYTGQVMAVLQEMAPGTCIIDLFADAPIGNPKASAYLLVAYAAWFLAGTVFGVTARFVQNRTLTSPVQPDDRFGWGPDDPLMSITMPMRARTRARRA